VDDEGFLDPAELEKQLAAHNQSPEPDGRRIRLVSVSGASNVLGTCNELTEIARITHQYGARLLVDGAQLLAHRPIDISATSIDYFVFSAHKAYAPFGSGALIARKGLLAFNPAEWEDIRDSGEENVAGIAALGKALQLLQRIGLEHIQAEEQTLTARVLRGMAAIPGLKIHGIQDPESARFERRGGVIVFELKGWLPHQAARELAERHGIGLRTGCHCAHLLIKRLLKVPGWAETIQGWMVSLVPRINLPGMIRVSLGIENTKADIDALIQALGKLARKEKPPIPARAEDRQRLKEFPQMIARRVFAP
jgi:selenocysteine lyase/cysteine desulfurase